MDGPEQIKVRVKTLDGQEHIIEAERTAEISALKVLIESKTGIPPAGQRRVNKVPKLNLII